MRRCLSLITMALMASPAVAGGIRGQYVEARTCDVYVGACFANADTSLTGKNAVIGWKVEEGTFEGIKLDGLGVVAVLSTSDTLGLKQSGISRAVIIVDEKANSAQRDALVRFAREQGGELLGNVVAIRSAAVELDICGCKGGSCAILRAGPARITTRCIDYDHEKACSNDINFYPPLARGVKAQSAMALEHSFTGTELNETWKDSERRGAYVGSFEVR
ncbi:MAG: DUF1326 domain-containing protein [Gemmataceae bacterium]|nr:DUF1326 domain-containing protein [Gemmataceae bacterium]MDW8264326.1 DUF1326 domain-containing protein [Gemmataceae bacterium]